MKLSKRCKGMTIIVSLLVMGNIGSWTIVGVLTSRLGRAWTYVDSTVEVYKAQRALTKKYIQANDYESAVATLAAMSEFIDRTNPTDEVLLKQFRTDLNAAINAAKEYQNDSRRPD